MPGGPVYIETIFSQPKIPSLLIHASSLICTNLNQITKIVNSPSVHHFGDVSKNYDNTFHSRDNH